MNASPGPKPAPYAELARGLLRDRVLDAVGELLGEGPWSQVTMAEVAKRAGVSRQTVYNALGSRAELAQAYLGREADRFLTSVDDAVREHSANPRKALAAALEIFLGAAGEHPLVLAVTSNYGSEEFLPLVTTRGAPLIQHVSDHLTQLFIDIWPRLSRADAAPMADAIVRLAISYAVLPSGNPSRTGTEMTRLLGPRIDELLG